jgi:cyanate permease
MRAPTLFRIGLVGVLALGSLMALRLLLHWPMWIIDLLGLAVPPLLWRFVWKYRIRWKGKEYKVPGHD